MACARMAFNELSEKNPKVVFQLFTSGLWCPKASLLLGCLYCFSSVGRVKKLFKDNGIQVARKSIYTKMKCASMLGFNILTALSIAKMISENYQIDSFESLKNIFK